MAAAAEEEETGVAGERDEEEEEEEEGKESSRRLSDEGGAVGWILVFRSCQAGSFFRRLEKEESVFWAGPGRYTTGARGRIKVRHILFP